MEAPLSADSPKPLRVFVVENHRDTLEAMQMYLELLGYTVLTAGSMTQALAALPQADCDVLISDIGLGDGDGWELLRRVQGLLPRPVYAIAMTGSGMEDDHVRSQEAGYRRHLLKPINPEELEAVLLKAARERGREKI